MKSFNTLKKHKITGKNNGSSAINYRSFFLSADFYKMQTAIKFSILMKRVAGFAILFLLFSPINSAELKWKLAPQSTVSFEVDATLENVTGFFGEKSLKQFSMLANKPETIRGVLSIQTASVSTGNSKRDNHLTQDDFFYSEKYPEAVVEVLEIEKEDGDRYLAYVKMTIRGQSKEYEVPVKISRLESGFFTSGKFRVNRNDFGIEGNVLTNRIMDDSVILRFQLLVVPVTNQ